MRQGDGRREVLGSGLRQVLPQEPCCGDWRETEGATASQVADGSAERGETMNDRDIGMSPDYGRDEGIEVECPECGSMDTEVLYDGIEGHCLGCGAVWAISPDPNDYPEYDR